MSEHAYVPQAMREKVTELFFERQGVEGIHLSNHYLYRMSIDIDRDISNYN